MVLGSEATVGLWTSLGVGQKVVVGLLVFVIVGCVIAVVVLAATGQFSSGGDEPPPPPPTSVSPTVSSGLPCTALALPALQNTITGTIESDNALLTSSTYNTEYFVSSVGQLSMQGVQYEVYSFNQVAGIYEKVNMDPITPVSNNVGFIPAMAVSLDGALILYGSSDDTKYYIEARKVDYKAGNYNVLPALEPVSVDYSSMSSEHLNVFNIQPDPLYPNVFYASIDPNPGSTPSEFKGTILQIQVTDEKITILQEIKGSDVLIANQWMFGLYFEVGLTTMTVGYYGGPPPDPGSNPTPRGACIVYKRVAEGLNWEPIDSSNLPSSSNLVIPSALAPEPSPPGQVDRMDINFASRQTMSADELTLFILSGADIGESDFPGIVLIYGRNSVSDKFEYKSYQLNPDGGYTAAKSFGLSQTIYENKYFFASAVLEDKFTRIMYMFEINDNKTLTKKAVMNPDSESLGLSENFVGFRPFITHAEYVGDRSQMVWSVMSSQGETNPQRIYQYSLRCE